MWWLCFGVGVALAASNCSADDSNGPVTAASSSSSSSSGAGASGGGGSGGSATGGGGAGGATGGSGGSAGSGGAACPTNHDVCHTSADPNAPDTCCGVPDQCCTAAANGYTNGDKCLPIGTACPIGCPNGVDACPPGEYCLLDASMMSYSCQATCAAADVCAGNVCCPLGSACSHGQCVLPDIAIDKERLAGSVSVGVQHFDADACEIMEGCIDAPGDRTLLLFDSRTPNVGAGDLVLGHPQGNPLFQYSSCHHHYHFSGYSTYQLQDANGNVVANGHKQAFCLEDLDPNEPNAPPAHYSCANQGIQAGWADVYSAGLPCQWIDVTGVPPGQYKLFVEINPEHILAESDYSNNAAVVDATIPFDSCPNGCRPTSETCCQPGDPCGWGNDGSCDCGGYFGWEAADCSACPVSECGIGNTCPGGCTAQTDPTCCVDGDPCGLANDGVCACGGTQPWDSADCAICTTNDPDCPPPPQTCNGCSHLPPNDPCCTADDICNYANDGWCDCTGQSWDDADCALCSGTCS